VAVPKWGSEGLERLHCAKPLGEAVLRGSCVLRAAEIFSYAPRDLPV